MAGVRFTGAALEYGCHRGSFDFPEKPEPVLVAGANGAGKSTLLEGLVRTLFGFNRKRGEEGRISDERQPWGSESFRGEVTFVDRRGASHSIERDFASGGVVVRHLAPPGDPWNGDGNPAGTNVEAREYREKLRSLVGLGTLEDYERTAYVQQGNLLDTSLDQDLLRAAAGSTVDVDRAREAVNKAHRELTSAPISDEHRAGHRPRRREELQQRARAAEDELARAVEAGRRRGPLLQEIERHTAELERLGLEIERLEGAQLALADRRLRQQEVAAWDLRLKETERRAARLERARSDLELARARWREIEDEPSYPDDFLERAAALEQLWDSRRRAEARSQAAEAALRQVRIPASGWTWGALSLAAAGCVGWLAGYAAAGLVTGSAGLLLAVASLVFRANRRSTRDERRTALVAANAELNALDEDVTRLLVGVPDAETLGPQGLADRRATFRRRQSIARDLESAEQQVEATARDVLSALGAHAADASDAPEALLQALGDRTSQLRSERAEKRLLLERAMSADLGLPQGVGHDLDEVRRILRERRVERDALGEVLRRLERRLLEEGRPSRSPVALGDELERLGVALDEVAEAILAHRAAFELLGSAQRSFRDEDQQRLLGHVSEHLQAMSEGHLGPVEASGDLGEATLGAAGRRVALDYRPLSYGQLHVALLAVRLGAADFLARAGIRVPLIIDEPFANLDDVHAAAVWKRLRRIAAERQVIVATQELALLERLGVAPDIRLGHTAQPVATD